MGVQLCSSIKYNGLVFTNQFRFWNLTNYDNEALLPHSPRLGLLDLRELSCLQLLRVDIFPVGIDLLLVEFAMLPLLANPISALKP